MSHHPIDLLAEQAALRLPPAVHAYVEGAAGDGATARRNLRAFADYALIPSVGIDVATIDTRTAVPGVELPHPVILAPTAFHELYHPDGEAATARGATDAGALLVLSSDASQPLEDTAPHLPRGFYCQLAPWRDARVTRSYVRRAEDAGARALVLTLDSAVSGPRYQQHRCLPDLPPSIRRANFVTYESDGDPEHYHRMSPTFIDPSATWATVESLVGSTTLPVIAKGIMHGRDAARAVGAGVSGIMVSNHGGRNLDNAVSTLEMLPSVVAAVGDAVPVMVDGGVRRGSDVLTALALGARAVLVGRPYVWGLAAEGAAGVRSVVEILVHELRVCMALCGVTSVRDVPGDVLASSHRPGFTGPV